MSLLPALPALPDDVGRLLSSGRGVFSTREAQADGITRARVARLAQAGLLVRLADGVYAAAEEFAAAAPWPAFALRTRAFLRACGPQAVAAGRSAVALLGLPAMRDPPPLPLVHVPREAGRSSNNGYGQVRAVPLPPEHCAVGNGCRLTSVARTVVDLGRTVPRADALVLADAAATSPQVMAAMKAVLVFQSGWPGSRAAAWVVEHADPYAESALETLGRLTFLENDLPVPVSNAWIDTGRRRYRVDHLVPERWLVFEGDGSLKYDNRLDAGRVVAEQREREWQLRELGLEVVRYGWELARHDRQRLAARFAAALAASPKRPIPVPWWRAARPRPRRARWPSDVGARHPAGPIGRRKRDQRPQPQRAPTP